MSFLANLRATQASPAEVGVCLLYLFSFENEKLHLRLGLGEINNGMIKKQPDSYRLQLHHLRSPPAFLTPSDIELLQNMLNRMRHWASAENTVVEQIFNAMDWRAAMQTKRAALLTQKGDWVLLQMREEVAGRLAWHWLGEGSQVLRVDQQGGAQVVCFDKEWFGITDGGNVEPLVFDDSFAKVCNDYVGRVVGPNEVEAFVAAHQNTALEQLGLLPQIPQTKSVCASLTAALYCHSEKGQHFCELIFRYQAQQFCLTINYADDEGIQYLQCDDRLLSIQRAQDQEEAIYTQLRVLFAEFTERQRGCWLANEQAPWLSLLVDQRRDLEALNIAITFSPQFHYAYYSVQRWQASVAENGVGEQAASFKLAFQGQCGEAMFDGLSILDKLIHNRDWVELQGPYIEINDHGRRIVILKSIAGALAEEFADLSDINALDGHLPLTQLYRVQALDSALEGNALWQDTSHLLPRAQSAHDAPLEIPASAIPIQAELRSYQLLGVCWIQHLKRIGLNGLLADDMGLGKTLQTLAHVSLEFAQTPTMAPVLIVAPTSLLGNWLGEIKKFCPHLNSVIYHGTNRDKLQQQLDDSKIWITSYPLVVRDQVFWQTQSISWLVLDEAQSIKNPKTQVSQALRQLTPQYKLCLSGTPVENHLQELWSIVDFLMPDYLGALNHFKAHYQRPIEQDSNAQRMQKLLDRVAPLMMRRTKQNVVKDLPEKTVILKSVALSAEQMDFYDDVRTFHWQNLEEDLASDLPQGQKQVKLLTAITKLRQACCDPKLLGEETVASAKTTECLHMIEELVDEGRSVLVFSQFTRMLDILSEHLDTCSIPHLMLTGASRNRTQLVERFQNAEASVFLISLKAGGVGLNLTRADTVIHFDPWWNSAAEEQASDRAHRIGQTQPVFVYKLITEHTIEEKIAQMQQAKAAISDVVNQQAQIAGKQFGLRLQELIDLWQES